MGLRVEDPVRHLVVVEERAEAMTGKAREQIGKDLGSGYTICY